MTKSEEAVIRDTIRRLQGDEIDSNLKHHFDALRLYLDTWVIPRLNVMIEPQCGRRTGRLTRMRADIERSEANRKQVASMSKRDAEEAGQ